GGAATCAMRTVYFKATANNHTSGTWGDSQCFMGAVVIRGQNPTTPIGGHAEAGNVTSTGVVTPAVTLGNSDGSSLLLSFQFGRTTALDAAVPGGHKRQALDSTYGRMGVHTKNDSTTDGTMTITTA